MVGAVHIRRRQFVAILMFVAALLSACGGEVVLPDNADEEIIQGWDVYRGRCAQCHGADGGGGVGLNLQNIETRLTDDEQRVVIENGRRRMPAFGSTLSDDDIDAVIRFSREVL